MYMMDFFRELLMTEDTKVMFILGLIAIAMCIDFITGTFAAKVNTEIEFGSKKGINGIIRKLSSLILLIFFIPISVLFPLNTGIAALYVLYIGYLVMEVQSIIENQQKMGNKTDLFKRFIDSFKSSQDKDKDDKEGD